MRTGIDDGIKEGDGDLLNRVVIAYVVIAVAMAVVVIGMPFYGSLKVGVVFGVFVGEVAARLETVRHQAARARRWRRRVNPPPRNSAAQQSARKASMASANA